MFKIFNITCDEATTICDKSQYGEATLYEKIQLNWHLLVCKVCALYTKQNKKMTNILKLKANDCSKDKVCLSSTDKEELKKQLNNFN